MSDIVEKVRAEAYRLGKRFGSANAKPLYRAADEIERLSAENKELALKVLQAESQTCEALDDLTAAYMSGSHDGERKGYRRGMERAAEIAVEFDYDRMFVDKIPKGIARAIRKEIDQ